MGGGVIADLMVRFGADVSPMERDMRRANRAMDETGRQSRTLGRRIQENRRAFTMLGMVVAGVGLAITGALKVAGDEAIQFESTTTKMVTQIGLARDEADSLGDAALGLTHTTRGPQELGDALFFVTSAGMRGSEALDVVEASAKAAAIGLGDTAQVADLVTSAVNAYGSDVLGAEQATDILVGTVREGKASADELTAAMGQVLPVASEMGVRFDEVGAATAAMTRTGTNAGTAAMQLRQILSGILKPAQGVEDAMGELGTSAEEVRATIRERGLWQALMDLKTAAGDNEAALGQLFPNVRALSGFLDLTGANAASNAEVFDSLADSTGLLNDGFEEYADTTEAMQARASAAWESARISIGEATLGVRTSIAEASAATAEWLADLEPATRDTVVTLGSLLGVTATVGGGFLLLAPRIVDTIDAMRRLRATGFSLTRFLLGPWGLAIGAAALAIGGFIKAKHEAERRVDDFVEAIKADSGAIAENSREHAINQLQKDGGIATAREYGLSLEQVTDAALGDAAAHKSLHNQLTAHFIAQDDSIHATTAQELAYSTLAATLGDVPYALEEAEVKFRDAAEAQGGAAWEAYQLERALGDVDYAATQLTPGISGYTVEAGAATEATSALEDEARRLAEQVEDMTDTQERWSASLASMSDPVSVYQGLLDEKSGSERDAAEAAAEAAGESASAWEDFADDVSVSLGEYADALEEHLADTREFETNLMRIASTVGADVALILAEMGDEGIALAGEMVDGTHEEVERLAGLLREEANRSGEAYAVEFEQAMRAIEAITREGGEATMAAFAEELGVGVHEARRIADRAGIKVDVSTTQAIQKLVQLRGRLLGMQDTYTVNVNARTRMTGPGLEARADGGPFWPGQDFLVGERGPEIVRFSGHGQVFDAPKTERMLAKASQQVAPTSQPAASAPDSGGEPIHITLDLGEGITQRYRIERTREGQARAVRLGAS